MAEFAYQDVEAWNTAVRLAAAVGRLKIGSNLKASADAQQKAFEQAGLACALLASRVVLAAPQLSTGLTLGGGISGLRQAPPFPSFYLGARASLLFGRPLDDRMRAGPYVEALTVAGESFEPGAGLEWLLPAITGAPFVLGAGGHARYSDAGWQPGVHGSIFFGSRSYNHSSVYGVAGGVFMQGRLAFGDARQGDVLLGVYVDSAFLALPVLLLINAFR